MSTPHLNLPNLITAARILACPVIFMLAIAPGTGARFAAFVLFVIAGLSDVWDGYLARRYDQITDMGKLLDPVADKLLLASTFIPFYLISHRGPAIEEIPWWGPMPMWVMLVIFGRELFITAFRSYAVRRGVVIAAGKAGKRKALLQALFVGGLLLWYPVVAWAEAGAWSGAAWTFVSTTIQLWVGVTLLLAIVLTVYSLIDYLWSYRAVVGIRD